MRRVFNHFREDMCAEPAGSLIILQFDPSGIADNAGAVLRIKIVMWHLLMRGAGWPTYNYSMMIYAENVILFSIIR